MLQRLNESDKERLEWCVTIVREIANLGRDKPLGDLYPQSLQVIGALNKVLEQNTAEKSKKV